MNTMKEITEEIKNIISIEMKERGKIVKDADVAEQLGVSPQLLATAKNRGKVLFKEVSAFCAKKKIAINTLLFGQDPKSLEDNTNKYLMYKYCLFH